MKKAVLLLGMVTLIAGCIYLKNADVDTVLFHQHAKQDMLYAGEYQAEYTEEISSTKENENQENNTESPKALVSESKQQEQDNNDLSLQESITSFVFTKLSPDEQKIYVEILDSLLSYEAETELSTTDSALIDRAFNCVMLDHPEIFYIDGYKYTEYASDEKIEKIVFTGNYLYEKEEIKERQRQIDSAVLQILANVPDTEDEYLQVKYIYDTIVEQTEYDVQAVDNQNICSVFLYGKSVCQGYAKAMQYLLKELEIDSVLVLGTVTSGEGHAWNLVSVNGQWYYLDATWGDAFYLFGETENRISSEQLAAINYDYLCVTTDQLMQTHKVDMPVALPECISMTDNYYVREGLYFTSFDEEKIRQIFAQAVQCGQESVTIKCSDKNVYEKMCRILLDEQKVFEYLSTEGTIAYTDNADQESLTFWL